MSAVLHRPAWPAPAPYAPEPEGRLVRVPEPIQLRGFHVLRRGSYPLVGRYPSAGPGGDRRLVVAVASFGWYGPKWMEPKNPPPGPHKVILQTGWFDALVEAGAEPAATGPDDLFDLLSP